MSSLIDAVSGMAGACACTYTGLPFDVAKVRLQSGMYEYRGTFHCLYAILRSEGLAAWYRGVLPALSSSIAENATGLTVQRAMRRAFSGDGIDTRLSMGHELAIGAGTGMFTCVAMNPFEVIKTRLQLRSDGRKGQIIAEVGRVMRAEGVSGLFRGLSALWARDIPFNAFFFGSYESITTLLMQLSACHTRDQLSGLQVCFAGGAAGVVGWSVVVPFDVCKTRMQASHAQGGRQSVMGVFVAIMRREGITGLYHGWSAAVLRAFPANAAMFLGVEFTDRLLRRTLAPAEVPSQAGGGR